MTAGRESDATDGRDATTLEMPVLPQTVADPATAVSHGPIALPSGWPAVVGDDPIDLKFDLPDGTRLSLRTSYAAKVWTATLAIVRRPDASDAFVDLLFFSKVTGATTHGRALRAVVLAGIEAGFLRSA